ncbi:spindle assembly abnormal protein 6 homolog [Venturia canescens]|uniref:spindle assembly abnormal protein 6 homolog n=1 Tax=Venturia canescens TaxID=32260 RepID=UPI001C9CBE06|nr:spindle assembly abnormal protein 6 homolog [Venturia canescens]
MNYLNSVVAGGGVAGDAGLQLNNVEVLYTKVQRVYVKPQHKEERQRELRVNVEIHAGLSPVCRKSLCVLLSDDEDPCFLYSLLITEDDFKILKAQQGLLVDFDNFATQLICLLEQCLAAGPTISKTTPKFLLILAEESNDWICKLVETNNFKHLCHLSLNIAPASDSDLKTHMAMKIKQLKENLANKSREVANLESSLGVLNSNLEIKNKELDKLEQKYSAEKSRMEMSSTHQITIEKDRLSQAKLEWQRQSDIERLELERKHTEVLNNLHTELAELRAQNMTYKDKQSYLEATNKEQMKQLQNLEKELNVAQRDLAQLKKQNAKLDSDYHERDKTVNSLRTRVAVLEQELKDKTILINKHGEMLKTAKEQKQHLDELLAERESQLQRKQNSLKNLGDELMKANEILTKMQNELASTKSKLKLRTSIALEQERLLETKQKEISQLESKIESLAKEAKDERTEVDTLKEQIKTLQNLIEDKDKTIKNNDNVISWLNRRLADGQSPLQSAATPAPITAPSIVQLTLPRANRFFPNKFETRTPAPVSNQSSIPMSGLPLRNPIVQNPNINQTARTTGRSMGVGIVDGTTPSLGNFNKTGQITSTSTPMDRLNGFTNKLPSSGGGGSGAASMPAIIENNNMPVSSSNSSTKPKSASGLMQGGLRRAVMDKPLLPSSYFPKSLH